MLWETVKALISSKKALAALAGVIVALAAKWGLALETEAVLGILSPVLAYILGQGMADFGKERV